MHFTLTLGAILLATQQTVAALKVRTIYQFASNETWLENLAITSCGKILATEIGPPARLLEFDPSTPGKTPRVVHDFSKYVLGLSGITEAEPNIFYVTGSNVTSSNIFDPPLNSTKLWRVAYDPTKPAAAKVSLVSSPKIPKVFNGLAAFNSTLILASDSFLDCIWAVDTRTGHYYNLTSDSLMKGQGLGINGLKVRDGDVYFTNGGTGVFAKLVLNADAVPVGPAVKVATADSYDDFGFDARTGIAYAATSIYNTVQQILVNGSTSYIAGSLDSTEIAEPTSCAVGRTQGFLNTVFVTTGGGSGKPVDVNGTETAVGAQLLAIEL